MGIGKNLVEAERKMYDNSGKSYTIIILPESRKQEWIDKYGPEQIDKWIENKEIMFIPVPPVALDFIDMQLDISTYNKLKEIQNERNRD